MRDLRGGVKYGEGWGYMKWVNTLIDVGKRDLERVGSGAGRRVDV